MLGPCPPKNPRCSRPYPSALTEEALKRIGELYAIESELRGKRAEERQAVRHQKVLPLLASLEGGLREKQKTLSRHSELAKAVTNGAIVIHTQRLKSDPGGNLLS